MKRTTIPHFALVVGALLFAGSSLHAGAAPVFLGEQIVNGGFGTNASPSLASWTFSPAGGEVNGRASTDPINASTGALGFDGFFTSAFAVLGDSAGPVGAGPPNGTMLLSQTFVLPATIGSQAVIRYRLDLSVDVAFDGVDTASSGVDSFFAEVLAPNGTHYQLFAWDSDANLGSSAHQSDFLTGLLPGSYTINFWQIETNVPGNPAVVGETNTAGGVDNVSIRAIAFVPDVNIPEPGAFGLLSLGLMAIFATRRRARRIQ